MLYHSVSFISQVALAEPGRAYALHKARLLNDASHDIAKATAEAEGLRAGHRKRKMLAAAPAYLKKRVEEDKELPKVELESGGEGGNNSGRRRQRNDMEEEDDEKDITREVVKHVIGGEMLKELYHGVMDMMAVKWADRRGHA